MTLDVMSKKYYSCERKKLKFKNEKAAKRYVKNNLRKIGKFLIIDYQIYKCQFCEYYHIGHKKR